MGNSVGHTDGVGRYVITLVQVKFCVIEGFHQMASVACELTGQGLSWETVRELAVLVPVVSDIDVQYKLQKETISLETKSLKEYEHACFKLRSNLRDAINEALVLCGANYKLRGLSYKKTISNVSWSPDHDTR